MNAEEKLARQRLDVLELGQALGNVSEACRQRGVSRTQFYEYKRRFQTYGIQGLLNRPPIHKRHPFTTPSWMEERILALSLDQPDWGCGRLSDYLRRKGVSVSSPTIQRILVKHAMGTRSDRRLKLYE